MFAIYNSVIVAVSLCVLNLLTISNLSAVEEKNNKTLTITYTCFNEIGVKAKVRCSYIDNEIIKLNKSKFGLIFVATPKYFENQLVFNITEKSREKIENLALKAGMKKTEDQKYQGCRIFKYVAMNGVAINYSVLDGNEISYKCIYNAIIMTIGQENANKVEIDSIENQLRQE